MNLLISIVSICLIALFPPSAFAKKPTSCTVSAISFRQLTQKDGLSQSNVNDIMQDRMGFLWIGTESGLNRYDGYEFRHFFGEDGLPNEQVTVLLESRDGMIWIGTRGGGIARLDPGSFQVTTYSPASDQAFALRATVIQSLYEDSYGGLWIGSQGEGLQYLDRKSGQFYFFPKELPGLRKGTVYGMVEDGTGRFWAGTTEGLYELVEIKWTKEGEWVGKAEKHQLRSASEQREVIYALCRRPEGGIWMNIWDYGLAMYDPDSQRKQLWEAERDRADRPPAKGIKELMVDSQGHLWLCNFDGGLSRLDTQTGLFTHFRHEAGNSFHLKSDYTTCILEDRAEVLWVGTYGGGLNHYSPYREKFALFQQEANNANSLSNDQVFGMTESRFGPPGTMWIGTHGNGLNLRIPNPSTAKDIFRHFAPDPNNPASLSYKAALCTAEDSAGNVWIGTYQGLNRLPARQVRALAEGRQIEAQFERFLPDEPTANGLGNASIWSLLVDRQGRMWVGTQRGLYQYLPARNQFSPVSNGLSQPQLLASASIMTLFQDSKDRLWIGTTKGVLVLPVIPDPGTSLRLPLIRFEAKADHPNSLRGDWIYRILEDQSERIWIGTRGQGIYVLKESERLEESGFQAFGESDGLCDHAIRGMELDLSGQIWVSSLQGLCTFHPDSLLAGSATAFRSFDTKDGLQGNEFNEGSSAIGRDGRMYFGGMNGFNAFYPEAGIGQPA